jgi:hypothetical protein
MTSLRKHLSVALVLLFLFPFIEKEVHNYSLKDDFHCAEKTTKHLHTEEHNCFICDFTIPFTDCPVISRYQIKILDFPLAYLVFNEREIISTPDYFVSLRAPPFLA